MGEVADCSAHLLCDAAETRKNSKEYQELGTECEPTLSNKEPNVGKDSQSKTGRTREERIAVARLNLQALLKKARDAYLSAQTKSVKSEQSDPVKSKIASPSLPAPSKRLKETTLNKIVSKAKTKVELLEFWRSWAVDEKRPLLEFRIVDLKKNFVSWQDGSAATTFSEAISFAHKYKTWKFWLCFICDDKFSDSEQREKHLALRHNAKFPENGSGPVEFDKVDASWADKLVKGTWKPVDTSRFVKSIQEKSKCAENNDQKWPIADDKRRAAILGEIHGLFKEILLKDWITMDQLKLLVDSAVYELGIIIPKSHILDHALDQTHFCFCFLEVPQLEHVHHYLLRLAINAISKCEVGDIKERIVISDDMSRLFLDERILTGELTMENYDVVVTHDASAATGTISYDEIYIPPDGDSFVHWLYAVPSVAEVLRLWKCLNDAWKNRGKEFLRAFDTGCKLLDALNKNRTKVSRMQGLLRNIEKVHNRGLKMMKQGAKHAQQSVASAFWKETKQRYESNLSEEERVAVDTLSNLIKAGVTLKIDLTGTNSLSRDTECTEHIHPQDAWFRIVLQRELYRSSLMISHLSSRIMRVERIMQQMKAKLEQGSYIDYRHILLPLLKLFMQEHFQALLENDAKQRSDAAMEALLEQVAEGSSNNIDKEGSQASRQQQNAKDKKKKKPYRRLKNLEELLSEKAILSSQQRMVKNPKVGFLLQRLLAGEGAIPIGIQGENSSPFFFFSS
ncbi:hypothetical protein NMG60_11007605 [Bertholletia excelsa]